VPELSVIAWVMSAVAVVASGLVARAEGHWRHREGLDIGFAEHGGMWGDLLLLPLANAAIVPYLVAGGWLVLPFGLAFIASLWLHARWHGGHRSGVRDHMWPSRRHGRWFRDLSLAGWLHVAYVTAELGLILAWALSPMPASVVWLVAVVLTIHVPIGLLHPGWFATRRRPTQATSLLASSLASLWATVLVKLL
jgi:hypothetical protein